MSDIHHWTKRPLLRNKDLYVPKKTCKPSCNQAVTLQAFLSRYFTFTFFFLLKSGLFLVLHSDESFNKVHKTGEIVALLLYVIIRLCILCNI